MRIVWLSATVVRYYSRENCSCETDSDEITPRYCNEMFGVIIIL